MLSTRSQKNIINIIFLTALLIVVITNFFAYQQLQRQFITNGWVAHTHQVISKTHHLLFNLLEIQGFTQTYFLSHNTRDLKQAITIMQTIPTNFIQLKLLVADNPVQAPKIIAAQLAIDSLLTHLNGLQHVTANLQLQTGILTDLLNIKNKIDAIQAEELILLKIRNADAQNYHASTSIWILIVGALSTLFLLLSYLWLTYFQRQYLNAQIKINLELAKQHKLALEATRLKSEFLANMSHELRTPLNAVIGFSELMYEGDAGTITAQQKEFLEDIISSAKHLLHLINDVLDLSKIEAGKLIFIPQSIHLENLVKEVVSSLFPLITKKKIEPSIEIDSTLNTVMIDPDRFMQILYNYLANAIKFTDEFGFINVRLRDISPTQFKLEVEDNGIGIAAEDIKRLFVDFQQLDASAKKKYPGTGLGLALTKRLVEGQGGQVGIYSRPGQGSVFSATLPKNHIVISQSQHEAGHDRANSTNC